MEQQTVSIAKAGIICSLNSRTSVLASANPIDSKYDPKRSVVDNINLGPTLLSRFDLIYLILDKPDERTDRMLAQHLVRQSPRGSLPSSLLKRRRRTPTCTQDLRRTRSAAGAGVALPVGPPAVGRHYLAIDADGVHLARAQGHPPQTLRRRCARLDERLRRHAAVPRSPPPNPPPRPPLSQRPLDQPTMSVNIRQRNKYQLFNACQVSKV